MGKSTGISSANSVIDAGTLARAENFSPFVIGTLKSRYLLKEGRETPDEITASKKTKGKGMVAARNKMDGPYAWLVYDFAVGKSQLKEGHRNYLQNILEDISTYGKLHNKTGTILISGHASPSGIHGQNLKLANQRAKKVLNALVTMNPVGSERFPASWFFIRNKENSSAIYSVVKGTPTTPHQRALCRGVYIVLWLKRDIKRPDLFPEPLRERARGQIGGRFGKYEETFYYWVIDNWNYLQDPANKYVYETSPYKDGLFFKPPSSPLKTDKAVWTYLKALHKRFKDAAYRLKHKYTGVPGHSFLPAGGDPVRCYQQLARWIALDGHAREGFARVFNFMPGVAIQKSMNELIEMINRGKFGDKNVVWSKIEKYMKQNRIPMRVVKQPVK